MSFTFADRTEGGRALAAALAHHAGRPDLVVLGLPRGGVPVAAPVADALGAVLDTLGVRKLGVPGHEELAMGAIAAGGARVLNDAVVRALGIDPAVVDAVAAREGGELRRRDRAYRGDRESAPVAGRPTIVVDDGLATGATMRAAVAALRQRGATTVVVAVPVAPPATCAELAREVDELVCPLTPEPFMAVGRWYDDFSPTTDEEVRRLLALYR